MQQSYRFEIYIIQGKKNVDEENDAPYWYKVGQFYIN